VQKPPRLESSHTSAGAASGDRKTVLSIIHHPFVDAPPTDLALPATVGVIDGWVAPRHCMYSNSIRTSETKKPDTGARNDIIRDRADKCGSQGDPDGALDHATHILGIIAARRGSEMGPGVNPEAKVVNLQINPKGLSTPGELFDLASGIGGMLREDGYMSVFNLSFTYVLQVDRARPDYRDPLEAFIVGGVGKHRLFVAAAGKDLANDIPYTRNCPLRPVCMNVRNVLTVAATEVKSGASQCPALIASTNRGDGIDLAAPGSEILSTIDKDNIGAMTGSSQAAPLVAGAASLLYAKHGDLNPMIVKNRLIYSADICTDLKVLGGILNIKRALAFETSELWLDDRKTLMRGHFPNLGAQIKFRDDRAGGEGEFTLPLKRVKRLTRLPNGAFVMLYHKTEAEGYETAEIRRAEGELLEAPANIRFQPAAGGPAGAKEIDLKKQLSDYVARIERVAQP
jgi:subtilisin family serine protease